MPLVLLLLIAAFFGSPADAQERWRQLPDGASDYAVDLQSLALDSGVLRARVRTRDVANLDVVQALEVRCSAAQLRTVTQQQYDRDSGRPTGAAVPQTGPRWAEYTPGSEGHALVSSLCDLAQARGLTGQTEHSRV
jgi:hypothetical protein